MDNANFEPVPEMVGGFSGEIVGLDEFLANADTHPVRERQRQLELENTRLKQRILTLSVRLANYQKREEYFDTLRLEHTRNSLEDLIAADIVTVAPGMRDQLKLAMGLVP